jgi:hypothetical protein
MRSNLKSVKRVRVDIWREDDPLATATRLNYWRLRVMITPAEGDQIGAERVLDDKQLHRAAVPAAVLDYALGVMRTIVLKVLSTGELPEGR